MWKIVVGENKADNGEEAVWVSRVWEAGEVFWGLIMQSRTFFARQVVQLGRQTVRPPPCNGGSRDSRFNFIVGVIG